MFWRQAPDGWWTHKCGLTIGSTSIQIELMAEVEEKVDIFPKTQLLQWKLLLLTRQPQMNTGPSSRWPPLRRGSLELLKLILLEIPILTLFISFQVTWPFAIWFDFPREWHNAYFRTTGGGGGAFSVRAMIRLICDTEMTFITGHHSSLRLFLWLGCHVRISLFVPNLVIY